MKKLALLVITMMLVVSLAACGSKDKDTDTNTSGTNSKKLVVGVTSDWKTMDPGRAYEVFANFYFYQTYENLYMYEGSDLSNPKPRLAKEYKVDATGLVYTFTMDEGHKFSSGNPVTAMDVAFSFNRTMNLNDNAAALTKGIAKVESPDDKTVVVTLTEKDASFLTKITGNAFAVLDSKLVKEKGGTDAANASSADKASTFLNEQSAGSGPYVLKKWTKDTEMVLEKNPNYKEKDSVSIDQVIIKEISDPNVAAQMVGKSDIDIALNVGTNQVSTLKNNNKVKVESSPTATESFLLMNNSKDIGGPMSDPLVQQAVRYALDYNGYKKLAGDGALLPLSFVQKGMTGAKERPANYQNIDKAKELMKQAGYENGFTTDLIAAEFDSEGLSWTTIAEKAKEDLSKIGIKVEIKTGDIGKVIEDYRAGKTPFLVMHWSPDYFDLNNQLAFVPGENVGMRANWEASANPELVELSNKVKVELDTKKREELSGQMQDIMAEKSPYAFLVQHPKVYVINSELEGVAYNDLCKVQFKDIKFK